MQANVKDESKERKESEEYNLRREERGERRMEKQFKVQTHTSKVVT